MPIYVYQCDNCGVTFERQQSITDEPLRDCPECEGHVHRVIQPVGVIFKGSGFYVTDNRAPSPVATLFKGSGFYVTDNRAPSPVSTPGNGKSAKSSKTEAKPDANTKLSESKEAAPETST